MTAEEIQKMVWLQEEVKAGSVLVAELNGKCRKLEARLATCPECGNKKKVMSSTPTLSTLKCELVPCPTCQGKAPKTESKK